MADEWRAEREAMPDRSFHCLRAPKLANRRLWATTFFADTRIFQDGEKVDQEIGEKKTLDSQVGLASAISGIAHSLTGSSPPGCFWFYATGPDSVSYSLYSLSFFFWFGGILGLVSRTEFHVSPSDHVGFMPRLLYSSTHHSSESFIHLTTGWAQDAWLQWSQENWYFHLDRGMGKFGPVGDHRILPIQKMVIDRFNNHCFQIPGNTACWNSIFISTFMHDTYTCLAS